MAGISIIVPAFNCQDTIEETLNSISKQTFTDYEVWIVDDGSVDSTKEKVEKYCERDKRFHIFSKRNEGVAAARNTGVFLSSGEYVLFIDADDIMFENMLERLYNEIQSNCYDIAVCGYEMKGISRKGKISYKNVIYKNMRYDSKKVLLEDFQQLLDSRLLNVVWNKLISRKFIEDNNVTFDDFISGEDTLYNVKLMKYVNKMCIVKDPLYQYKRCDEGSLTTYFHKNKFVALKKYNDELRSFYMEWNKYNEMCQEQMDYYLIRSVISSISSIYDSSCKLSKYEKKDFVRHILYDEYVQKAAVNIKNYNLVNRLIAKVVSTKSISLNFLIGRIVYLTLKISPIIVENMK